jgi:hypothetical protein
MSELLLKCGHTANAIETLPDGTQKPSCVICLCNEPADDVPGLEGRKARCAFCGKEVDSSYKLAFFEYGGDVTSVSDQIFVATRSKLLPFIWKEKDKVKKQKMHEVLLRINQKIKESATRDSYYCGCRGWD